MATKFRGLLASDAELSEIEKLSHQCLTGEISHDEYWKRWEELREESKRQQVRDDLEIVLAGGDPPKRFTLPEDIELDAKMDLAIARKMISEKKA